MVAKEKGCQAWAATKAVGKTGPKVQVVVAENVHVTKVEKLAITDHASKARFNEGETVVTGNADGENIPGQSITEARADIQSSILGDTDPLEDQKLPRSQREHAKQYFDKLRGK